MSDDSLAALLAQSGLTESDRVYTLIERELRTIAAARLRRETATSMSTGDLINEAMIRLQELESIDWQGRPHVLALASTFMRRILIDHARRKNAEKRAHQKVTLVTSLADQQAPVEIFDLEEALQALREIDAEKANVVEMRFFGGMSNAQIGEVLELSEATVKRRWSAARAWLQDYLRG
ncbi:MAG: ECF-type sigma factor [Pseudomonadota bacterium]